MKQNTQKGTYITIRVQNIRIRIHNLQNYTETYKTYNRIYSDTNWNQKNMANETAI